MTRLIRTLPVLAALAALGVTGSASATAARHQVKAPSPTILYACVHAHGTSIRFVAGPGHCAHGEHLLVFHAAKPHRSSAKKHAHGDAGKRGAKGPAGHKGDTGKQGATGPKGDTGTQGPAGSNGSNGTNAASVTVKDSNGNTVGTLLFWNQNGGITVVMNDGTVATFDAMTGSYSYPQVFDFFYADANCQTAPYELGLQGPANFPFVLQGATATGSPVYTQGASQTNFASLSMKSGSTCSASSMTLGKAYAVQQVGVVPASPFTGPLTLATP